ncbi:hypothetical protein CPB84DRAFT_45401 [Gymnopilus junonius]|uniref:Uncharacterized protein n=1 Tax=Gymnopilus junonius TaxID=109634 RepID=A0A9P5P1K9_GYMJU|nr:hypothetical protein CPB84DRAFT_45401 [Gymnopilus junonius]
MEVGNPPTPIMGTSVPLNTTPAAHICSERHCNAIISRSSKGNLCEQCVMKIRSGRSFPGTRSSPKEGVPAYSIPVPARERSGIDRISMKKERPTSVQAYMAKAYRGCSNTVGHGASQYGLFQGPINFQSSTQILCDPISVVPGAPIISHFNSQGEVIQDVYQQIQLEREIISQQNDEQSPMNSILCLRCLRSVPWHYGEGLCPSCRMELATQPSLAPLESAIISRRRSFLVEKEISGDLNIAGVDKNIYSTTGIVGVGESNDPGEIDRELSYPLGSDSQEMLPAKDSQKDHMGPRRAVKRPKVSHPDVIDLTRSEEAASFSAPSNVISTVSTSVESTRSVIRSLRCLMCVQQEWKSKRSALSSNGSKANGTETSSETSKSYTSLKRKKMVTWADEVGPKSITEIGSQKLSENHKVGTGPTENATSVSTGVPKQTSFAPKDVNTSEISLSSCNQKNSSSMDCSVYDHRLSDSETSPTLEVTHIGGTSWGQDQDPASSSDSETELSHTPPSSSLKIRIPARPAGLYSRKCISPKCGQLLSTNYRWKSCVMCRARSRGYQRRRQNLQGRHDRLYEELMRTQMFSTSHFLSNDTTDFDVDAILTPGARLCAVRDCTFIIPPLIEYRWKMCALCRFQKKMRNQHETKENSSLVKSSAECVSIDPQSILKLLDRYRNRDPAPDSGRCQSIDCGMLVVDSASPDCKQCIARRLSVIDRNKSSCGPKGSTMSIRKRPASYAQYKCFSALLSEFKERLSGFLQSQSIFFLFKKPSAGKALFAFDGEYSVVTLDFNIAGRKEEIDASVLRLKREIEYVGKITFSPKRLVTVLDEGIAVRFSCIYSVPILQSTTHVGCACISITPKPMQCEMEVVVVADRSHRFIPGQRTVIRFRLFG